MAQGIVGIIANPASGKDIRRLVAHGTVFDNQEKINIVRRLLLALSHTGAERVLYMPDYHGLVEKAVKGLGSEYRLRMPVEPVDQILTATQEDSMVAARKMAEAGAGCLVTLGGDGTNRQVAKGTLEVPILAISTGTNNVFPQMVEATTAGLAAGVVAGGHTGPEAVYRAKRLAIYKNGREVDLALVDAVVTRGHFIGSRAMWEVDNMVEAAFTRGEPDNIGLASILGKCDPVSPREPSGAWLKFAPLNPSDPDAALCSAAVFAPIAPGLFRPVGLELLERLRAGEQRPVSLTPSLIALDGEREVELAEGDEAFIRLEAHGPLVVDMKAALAGAVSRRFFQNQAWLNQFCVTT